jgi:RNA recognition motif-containing protein
MQSQNLFVGSLAFATTDDSLKSFFETIGEVKSAKVITDRDSGRSRGFGFVEFEDPSLNEQAVKKLDGQTLDGREIKVSIAQPKGEGGGGPRRNNNGPFRRSTR